MKVQLLNRRRVLKTAAFTAAATYAPFMLRSARAAGDVVVASWGGDYADAQRAAFFDGFEKDTGNRVVIADFDLSKLQLMVDSGNVEWDLITGIQGEQASVAQAKGLLLPIDYSVVPKDKLFEKMAGEYFVAAEWYSAVLAWDKRIFPDPGPQSWADFWNVEKFPGPRALGHEALVTLLVALLADGADPASLIPIDYDRAFKSLDKIKSNVTVWYTANGQPPQLLVDGEVVMSTAYNGRIQSEMNKGAPLAYTWRQNIANTGGYAVPRGAKNATAAMQLLGYALDPERQAKFAKMIPYGVTNKDAFANMKPEDRAVLPTAPENIDQAILVDPKWLGENLSEMTERLEKYILA